MYHHPFWSVGQKEYTAVQAGAVAIPQAAAHWAPSRCYHGPAFSFGRAWNMKITLAGRNSVDEFADAIDRTLQNLRQNGVEEIQNANIYIFTYADRRQIHLLDEEGRKIEHLTFDGPRERPFRKVTDNVRVVQNPAHQEQPK
jgi:hypothetical protein